LCVSFVTISYKFRVHIFAFIPIYFRRCKCFHSLILIYTCTLGALYFVLLGGIKLTFVCLPCILWPSWNHFHLTEKLVFRFFFEISSNRGRLISLFHICRCVPSFSCLIALATTFSKMSYKWLYLHYQVNAYFGLSY
jgi:hypothetical protein